MFGIFYSKNCKLRSLESFFFFLINALFESVHEMDGIQGGLGLKPNPAI